MGSTQAQRERHLQALVRLHEAGRPLLLEPRLETLKARVLETGLQLLRADAICLATREDAKAPLSASQRGVGSLSQGVLADLLAAAEGAPWRAFTDPDARVPHLREDGFRSAIVAVLKVRETTLGHLVVLRASAVVAEEAEENAEAEAELAGAFAAQVSVALHAARANTALASRVEELLRTRDDLVLAEKLRLAGDLAGGLALALADPLAALRRGLEAVQVGAPDPSRDGALGELREGVRRIAVLAAELGRPIETPAPASRRPLWVGSSVERCVKALPAGRQAAFAIDVGEELCVTCSRDDLHAALTHVIGFLGGARGTRGAPERLRIRAYARGPHVYVAICDPTLRLNAEERRVVLDPRLRRDGPLRLHVELALAQQLLRRNGGDLVIIDAFDGTRFQLVLERGTCLELCSPLSAHHSQE